jgi:hypothetical protein
MGKFMGQHFSNNRNGFKKVQSPEPTLIRDNLPPAWRTFVNYCMELRHGEIESLKIQDGLPVIAEVTRQKIKFSG